MLPIRGLPGWIERLSWKTFQKVFHRDPKTGALRGWNVRLKQTGLDGESVPLTNRQGEPRTFGHYHVVPLTSRPLPRRRRLERGLLIDYGLGRNGRLDPIGRLRDPIVAVNPDSAELLLGWTYADLGLARVGTPSFFTLEREGPLSHRVAPPRG